uniref:Pentatricopeptide repeat-containing protein n=2 Tax=Kalanchoe fedtschenkoi TaxID=63787 RepID=A0A7N0UL22_KALFE
MRYYRHYLHYRCFSTCSSRSDVSDEYFHLCSRGLVKQAFETFYKAVWPDPQLFSHLLQAAIPVNSPSLSRQLHSLIITSGSSADRFVSNHLLNLYSKIGCFGSAARLFAVMPSRNIMSGNILINGYVQMGDLEGARQLFDEMPNRNLATWNAMLTGLVQFECNEEGLDLLSQMHELGWLPDEFALGSALRACAGLRSAAAGKQVHGYAAKSGLELNVAVGSSLAHMYTKSGSLEEGEKVIKQMPELNVVAWNTLIAGRAQHGYPEGVLDQYSMMKIAGCVPDKITFVSALSSCSELATLGQGRQIHAEVIKTGAGSIDGVLSSLISMYSRCGCLDESVQAFTESASKDPVLWSAMIAAYGYHGKGEEAIELFETLEKEAIEVNDVTFLSLLYACSHSGLKQQGVKFFDAMIEKYHIKPRVEHYTCLVDLLGRSGCLQEAEAKIRFMPVKPDTVIWKTLLSACKLHKNEEMAKRAAKEITQLDPHDSASYVLLSNIHASGRRWEEASTVRRLMKERNIKKEPGISWVEISNRIHQFCTSDKSRQDSKELVLYLKELTYSMKLRGVGQWRWLVGA